MTYLEPGMTVRTLDGEYLIVEWVRPRNEVEGFDYPKLIGDYVKLVGSDTLWFPWDLEWEGQFDDLQSLENSSDSV